MDKLYLRFIALLLASSFLGAMLLRVITGEIDAAMIYAFTIVSASAAGRWYARAAIAERLTALGDH